MKIAEIFQSVINWNWETIASVIAMVVSTYSFLSSRRLNKKISEQQIQINELLINKEKQYIEKEGKAEFRVYGIGTNGDCELVVANQGKADAKNVRLEIRIEQAHKGSFWNLNEVFPMNINSGQTGKTKYSKGSMDFPSKFIAIVTWDDEHKENNTKEFVIS